MRKKAICLTCFLLALSPAAHVFAADAEIPSTSAAITIDGIKDSAWLSTPQHEVANVVQGAGSKTGCSGSWRALWDSQYLYVFFDVNDSAVVGDSTSLSDKYNDDSVEVFIDAGNTKATTYAANHFQYRFGWDPADPTLGTLGADHGSSLVGIDRAFARTSTGYSVETRIPWAILYPNGGPSVGDLMGFEVQINDDDNGGSRDNQLDWHSTTNDAWQNPSVFGTVVLVVGSTPLATKPDPANKAVDVVRDTALSWTPGIFADKHDVYFGTSFSDVNAATASSPLLVSSGQDANSYNPPVRLDFGTTYYWRVDEINAPPSTATYKGDVWSFTTEPIAYKVPTVTATASSASATSPAVNTVNGSGLVGDEHGTDPKTMWLGTALPAWIRFDFDQVYKIHEMWVWNHNTSFESMLGFGVKNAAIEYSSDGTNWTSLGDFEFARATGADGIAPTSTIPFGGVTAKSVRIAISSSWMNAKQTGLSEVRFYYIPVQAREPVPATGTTNVDPTTVVLSWRAGREAASHDVYIGTDANAVAASTTPTGTSATASYKPSGLQLDGTYYWRVDEVNTAETYTAWAGPIWTFSTGSSLVADDMESYNDTTNKVFDTWADGYNTTTNGSQVGYDQSAGGTFNDTTTVHGGKQSMPFSYGKNNITTSEATRTFDTAQDWTVAGIKTLVLYFYGDPANSAAQLYVKINSAKVTYSGDAGNIQRRRWNQWNIDLASVSGGVKAVKTLTIGVSGSGTGTLLIDDICLYKNAPAVPTPVDPGTSNLVAYYAMSNNVQDSSGKGNNGTVVGTPAYEAGLSASNMALRLNGTTDCVNLGNKAVWNPTGSFSVSLWANIGLWSTAWNHVMIGNRGEDNVGWQIRRHSSASLCFTTRGVGNDDMASVRIPPLNEWIHVTCVYDNAANTKTLYINGLQDSVVTTTVGAHITATTLNTYIGARALADNTGPDTTTFFTGLLDEIRVYNRALTAGEADFLSKP
jgi:hypothetical protein